MARQPYIAEIFPQQINGSQYPASLNLYLGEAVSKAVLDEQSGEIEFNTDILDRIESLAATEEIHAAINDARQMSEISEKAAKNEQSRDSYSEIKLCLNALAKLYEPIPPKRARHAPNNPFAMPPEQGPSLSNVNDAMGHRSGKGR